MSIIWIVIGYVLLYHLTKAICLALLAKGRVSPERLIAFIADERAMVTQDLENTSRRLKAAFWIYAVTVVVIFTIYGLWQIGYIVPSAVFFVSLGALSSMQIRREAIDEEIDARRKQVRKLVKEKAFNVEQSEVASMAILRWKAEDDLGFTIETIGVQ